MSIVPRGEDCGHKVLMGMVSNLGLQTSFLSWSPGHSVGSHPFSTCCLTPGSDGIWDWGVTPCLGLGKQGGAGWEPGGVLRIREETTEWARMRILGPHLGGRWEPVKGPREKEENFLSSCPLALLSPHLHLHLPLKVQLPTGVEVLW